MPETIRNYIAGELVDPIGGGYLDKFDPAIGSVSARVPDSGSEDVSLAAEAASRAFGGWAATPAVERSRVLLRIADLIDRQLEPLALAESRDTGKPITLARTLDIPRAIANFRFFATAILHTHTEAHRHDLARAELHAAPAPRRRGADLALEPAALPASPGRSRRRSPPGTRSWPSRRELTPMTAVLLAKLSARPGSRRAC